MLYIQAECSNESTDDTMNVLVDRNCSCLMAGSGSFVVRNFIEYDLRFLNCNGCI